LAELYNKTVRNATTLRSQFFFLIVRGRRPSWRDTLDPVKYKILQWFYEYSWKKKNFESCC